MKKLILLSLSFLLISCSPLVKKRYTFEITYTNGDIDTLTYRGVGNNLFKLENTDLKQLSNHTLVSGVRSFKTLSVESLGELKKWEKGWTTTDCVCGNNNVILEPKIKEQIIETIE